MKEIDSFKELITCNYKDIPKRLWGCPKTYKKKGTDIVWYSLISKVDLNNKHPENIIFINVKEYPNFILGESQRFFGRIPLTIVR